MWIALWSIIKEGEYKNVFQEHFKNQIVQSDAGTVDYFTLFYNSLSQICILVMQRTVCFVYACASDPSLGAYVGVRGK